MTAFAVKEKQGWFSRMCNKLWELLVQIYQELTSFILRALEFHVWRLVFITVFAAAANQVILVFLILKLFMFAGLFLMTFYL